MKLFLCGGGSGSQLEIAYKKIAKVMQKDTTPTNWYGSPITTSSGWKTISINKDTTKIPISVLFTTDDPEDNNVTKSGELTIPAFVTNSRININGSWKDGNFYINVNGG